MTSVANGHLAMDVSSTRTKAIHEEWGDGEERWVSEGADTILPDTSINHDNLWNQLRK